MTHAWFQFSSFIVQLVNPSGAASVCLAVFAARMRRLFILYSYSAATSAVINHIDRSHRFIDLRWRRGAKQSSPLTRRVKLSANVTSLPVTCRRFSHVSLIGERCREIHRLSHDAFALPLNAIDQSSCEHASLTYV